MFFLAYEKVVKHCRDMKVDIYLYWELYGNAFNLVQLNILKKTGLDGRDTCIVMNLYWKQTAVFKVEEKEENYFRDYVW